METIEYVVYRCISCNSVVAKIRKGSLIMPQAGIICQCCITRTSFMFVKNEDNLKDYSEPKKSPYKNNDDIFSNFSNIFGDIFKNKK